MPLNQPHSSLKYSILAYPVQGHRGLETVPAHTGQGEGVNL